jgi:hypothetical protein
MNRFPASLLLSSLAVLAARSAMAQTFCPPIDFPALGPTDSPSNGFSIDEYSWCHSSTNLQGYPAYVKTAASLFYNPPGDLGTGVPQAFGAFSSAVIVNNPHNQLPTHVRIEYRSPAGVILGTTPVIFIPPNGTFVEPANRLLQAGGTGVGSARIVVENPEVDAPILGATLHYFDSIFVPGWGIVADPDIFTISTGATLPAPGEGSYQQLQATPEQGYGDGLIFAGPFHITNGGVTDFENGSVPVLSIANPHYVPVSCMIVVFGSDATNPLALISSRFINNLPAGGSVLDTSLWTGVNQLMSQSMGTYDFNLSVVVIAVDGTGQPRQLVGDALVIDAFGNSPNPAQRNLVLGGRMRMTSSMFADQPSGTLIAHEVGSFTPPGGNVPMLASATHIVNVGFAPTSQLTIEYFNRTGQLVGTDTVTSLPTGSVLHIGQGQPDSMNFPQNLWNGWLRVTSANCADRLIGWTHREIGPLPPSQPANRQFRKAFGEEMLGANRLEPGLGLILTSDLPVGEILNRKVMPLVRTTPNAFPSFWPGYTTFTNTGFTDNIGDYWYRFYDFAANDQTNYTIQPRAGVASRATSLAYEDSDFPVFTPQLCLSNGNRSGRVDTLIPNVFPLASNFDGINVLGDPFWEFGIPGFARRNLGPRRMTMPIKPFPIEPGDYGTPISVPWLDKP